VSTLAQKKERSIVKLKLLLASDRTAIGIPRRFRMRPIHHVASSKCLIGKLEEVEWLLNYARNANRTIPVTSAITTKKVNARRRLTPMRLLSPQSNHRRNRSAHMFRKETPRPELPCSLTDPKAQITAKEGSEVRCGVNNARLQHQIISRRRASRQRTCPFPLRVLLYWLSRPSVIYLGIKFLSGHEPS
jgi:hypothetical protein